MDTKAHIAPLSSNRVEYAALAPHPQRPAASTKEYLPFTIRLVHSNEDLNKALQIRYSAYARHVPTFAETLKMAEPLDNTEGVAILLAESKLDGSPLGTMRIQTNWFNPLTLEQSIELPEWLKNRSLAEATRLGVTEQSIGRNVKTALFKAYFQYCVQNGIEWMVIAGRSPIDRQYDRLLFSDVYPGMGYIPLRHANNMPHRVLAFEVGTAEERWNKARHPLTNFVFHTDHPDIDVGKRSSNLLQ